MDNIFNRLKNIKNNKFLETFQKKDIAEKRVSVIYGILGNVYGPKELVNMANRKKLLAEFQSDDIAKRVFAAKAILSKEEKHNIPEIKTKQEINEALDYIENQLADILSIKSIESDINKKVNEHLEKRHKEYVKEIKKKVINDESGPENEFTERKLKKLETMEARGNLKTVMEILRPDNLNEIVGQEKAIKALLTKLGTPYPQHILMYGPPGVGKTTAARLVLDKIKNIEYVPFDLESPFVEVDGSTLRWDPRDMTNPLTGSVHDPIYQGAQKDFAGEGIPEPKFGLVTDAHSGVLFIDEIGEMDTKYQSKLLKVMEDKRVSFESPYYDSENPKVPKYIKQLFEKGAPADFILIGATTKKPSDINPAIRSRVSEVFFEPLNKTEIAQIVKNASKKLDIKISNSAIEIIANYTIEGRKAVNILADVYSSKLFDIYEDNQDIPEINEEDVLKVIRINRLYKRNMKKGKDKKQIGKIFGLGVSEYIGSIIEIEGAKVTNGNEKGSIRFNDTAGSMAKDSVFNAMTVAKNYAKNKDIEKESIHINVIGGGKVDGPSAGVAITAVMISIIDDLPIRQDVAITGEISITGDIKPVGGIVEKVYGAVQAEMSKVLIPKENEDDLPDDIENIEVVLVETINDVINEIK